jgi:hypothetical protein
MSKFLVVYLAPISASEQMRNATPEQAKAGMDAWMNWAKKAGDAIVDLGAPLGDGSNLEGASLVSGDSTPVGYSILQAESMESVRELLRDHPHGRVAKFSIEVFECLSMPSEMSKQPSRAA